MPVNSGQLSPVEFVAHLFPGAVANLPQLPFGKGEHERQDELADMALGADALPAEIGDVQDDVPFAQKFQHGQTVTHVTTKAIQLGDDQMFHIAEGETVQQRPAAGTFAHRDAAAGIGVGKRQTVADHKSPEPGIICYAPFL